MESFFKDSDLDKACNCLTYQVEDWSFESKVKLLKCNDDLFTVQEKGHHEYNINEPRDQEV